jgi:class 3 adenylate cyclase/tetratricopeptide (TPR) repeat protein
VPQFSLRCPSCDQPLPGHGAFCPHCGHRLRAAPAGAAPARPPSERKYLTILCVDVQQSTALTAGMEPEEAMSRLEPSLDAMRAAVHRYGGIVSKELGDGLIALFGAPESDANHAVMACQAGLELLRRIAQLDDTGIRVRVGVHSGYVVVRVVSGDYSQIYDAGGPAMALANRLETAADAGQILASESCMSLAEGVIAFEAAGARSLKGFPHPVPVFRVAGFTGLSRWRVRSARSLARFTGRAGELAILERAARDCADGAGRIVSIIGNPGIGKSRIVHEFLERLAKTDWQIIEVECDPTNDATPYATLKGLLLSLAQSLGNGEFRINDYLADRGARFPGLWTRALDAVLDRPIDDPDWHELLPKLRERAIIDAFRGLIEHIAATRRTVLLIEDLHWVDGASSAAIEALRSLTTVRPLLLLLTSRPDAAPQWFAGPEVTRMRLRPLDAAAAGALLDALFGQSAELVELKARILGHTGRVPLFIEEVSRRLVETGAVLGEWGRFTLAEPFEQLGVPPTVQGVIAGRIDRLASQEKALLQAASAIGPRAEIALLRAVGEMTEAALQRSLAALDAAELLIEAGRIPEPAYEFAHDLIREVTYDTLLGHERERLHRRIFVAIDRIFADRTEDAAESLAHHAVQARAWAEAGAYAHLAARKCLARSALQEAARYFETAIEAVDKSTASTEREQKAIDLRIEARLVVPALGNVRRWIQFAAEAEQRAAAIGDAGRQVAALVDRATALNFFSTPSEAVPINERAVRRAEALGTAGWLAIAEYGLGQAYLTAGRYRAAVRILDRACTRSIEPGLEIPIGTTRPRHSVLCHMMKSVAHAALGELADADSCQRQASRIAMETGRPYDMIAADYGRGMFQLAWGSLEESFAAFDAALALARRNDVKQFIPVVACQFGNLLLHQGELARAHEVLVDARAEAERLGHILGLLRASTYLGSALARLGRVGEALQSVRSAATRAAREGFDGVRAEALLCEAQILSSLDPSDLSAASECVRTAIPIAARIDARPQVAACRALLGSILVRRGCVAAGIAELRAAVDLFATMQLKRPLEVAQVALADLLGSQRSRNKH